VDRPANVPREALQQIQPAHLGPIRQVFGASDQYGEVVAAADVDRAAQLRRLGRAVARELGWKIHTAAVPIDDDTVQVLLVITESIPLRDQAMEARRQRKVRDALREL
jgi:hypothetical protein